MIILLESLSGDSDANSYASPFPSLSSIHSLHFYSIRSVLVPDGDVISLPFSPLLPAFFLHLIRFVLLFCCCFLLNTLCLLPVKILSLLLSHSHANVCRTSSASLLQSLKVEESLLRFFLSSFSSSHRFFRSTSWLSFAAFINTTELKKTKESREQEKNPQEISP